MTTSIKPSLRLKNRSFQKDEVSLYLMGSFLYGETIEDLSLEHRRTDAFVKDKLIQHIEEPYFLSLLRHYIKQGKKRSLKINHKKNRVK